MFCRWFIPSSVWNSLVSPAPFSVSLMHVVAPLSAQQSVFFQTQVFLTFRLCVNQSKVETTTVDPVSIPSTLTMGNSPCLMHLYPWKLCRQLHSKNPGPYGLQNEFSGQSQGICTVWLQIFFCPLQILALFFTSTFSQDALPPGHSSFEGSKSWVRWLKPWNMKSLRLEIGLLERSIMNAVDELYRCSTWLIEQFAKSNPIMLSTLLLLLFSKQQRPLIRPFVRQKSQTGLSCRTVPSHIWHNCASVSWLSTYILNKTIKTVHK